MHAQALQMLFWTVVPFLQDSGAHTVAEVPIATSQAAHAHTVIVNGDIAAS